MLAAKTILASPVSIASIASHSRKVVHTFYTTFNGAVIAHCSIFYALDVTGITSPSIITKASLAN